MSFSYNPTTAAGQVRLLITDTDPADHYFEDSEITAFLTLEGDDVRLAAAQALDTIASNQALVEKRIKLLDLSTDGPAVAKELRERAKELRRQVDEDYGFDIAEQSLNDFAAREIVYNDALRTGSL